MTNIEVYDQHAWSALEVGLPVSEMEPMKHFYCVGLGFKASGYVDLPGAHIEAFRFGDCMLKLSCFADPARRPEPRDPNQATFYITLRVFSVDQTLNSCLTVGGRLLIPISSTKTMNSRTVRFAFVADPMGSRIELVEGDAWSG
jgi:predicted enzyme related to lactoylglutathione lyase